MTNNLISKLISYSQEEDVKQIVFDNKKNNSSCLLFKDNNLKAQFKLSQKMEEDLIKSFRFLSKTLENDIGSEKLIKIKYKSKIYNCHLRFLASDKDAKITMTLSENKLNIRRLSSLGFDRNSLKIIKEKLNLKSGLILIAGQAMQGKTSTYYSLLNATKKEEKSVYSLEKYPNQSIPFVSSLELDDKNTLKNYIDKINRIDADIIGIDSLDSKSEIKEAIKLALNGKLVIASISALSSKTALRACLNIGLKTSEVAKALKLIIAQHLLYKNCPYCIKLREIDNNYVENIKKVVDRKFEIKKSASSKGCFKCNFTGHSLQFPSFELMSILPNANIVQYKPMIIDALEKANNGVFSPEQILKLIKKIS